MRILNRCRMAENTHLTRLMISAAFLFSIILCGAATVKAQVITVDNPGAVKGDFNGTTGLTTTTLPGFTVGAGSFRELIVGVSTTYSLITGLSLPLPGGLINNQRVIEVRYGTSVMTRIGTQVSNDGLSSVEMFRLELGGIGSSTTRDIQVDLANVSYVVVGAISFFGVNQAAPVRGGTFASNSGNGGTTPTVTVTSQTGDIVVDTVVTQPAGGFLAPGAGQTERWDGESFFSNSFSVGAGSTEAGASSVTMSWQSVSQPWAIGAISLAPAASIVISELRFRGASGANDEFIELFNRSTTPIDIGNYRIFQSTASGVTSSLKTITSGTILNPGCHYLLTGTGTNPYNDGVTGDDTYSNTVNSDGGIALTVPTASGGSATTGIIDQVGLSAGSAYKEGTPLPELTTNTDQTYERKPGGAAGSTVDTNDNTADFTLRTTSNPQNLSSGCVSVTLATLNDFTAYQTKQGVLLDWQTSYEVNNLGFNLYREVKGTRLKVNPSIIGGSAFLAGVGTRLTAGNSYSWSDPQGKSNSVYWLEDIDLDGTSTMHGPITPVANSVELNFLLKRQQSALLSQLSIENSNGSQVIEQGIPASADNSKSVREIYKQTIAEHSSPNILASWPAIKLSVRKSGWYRVTQPELVAAGLDPSTDARNLQLYAEGVGQSIGVSSKSGRMDAGSYIEFYGTGLDTLSTGTRTYWLVTGSSPGERISMYRGQSDAPLAPKPVIPNQPRPLVVMPPATTFRIPFITILPRPEETTTPSAETKKSDKLENATRSPYVTTLPESEPLAAPKPKRSLKKKKKLRSAKKTDGSKHQNHPSRTSSTPQSFVYTLERKERSFYFSALQNGDAENFFGKILSTTPIEQTINVHHLDAASSEQPILEVVLQGGTTQAHQVQVLLNGEEVGILNFTGQINSAKKLPLSQSLLREGDNTVKLVAQAGEKDVTLVDTLRLTYAHLYRADKDVLHFTARSPGIIRADGFTNANVRVMDITNPGEVREIAPQVESEGAGYAITFQIGAGQSKGARTLLAFTDNQFEHPVDIKANQPSSLGRSEQSADFLIIMNGQFRQSVEPLASLRRNQGMMVSVVDVEDIFDEFSYGAHSTKAIKDFLLWTTTHWQRAPRFVLLVGDGSYDPRNYQGRGDFDLVPTKMLDTSYMETAADDWFADFNNDDIPEMAMGRLPVRTVQEAQAVISKIVNYQPTSDSGRGVLLVSDRVGADGYNFEAASNDLKALIPNTVNIQTIVRGSEDAATTRAQIINGLNQGQLIANYAGHGAYERWAGDGVLRATDASALTNNGKTSLFVTMTCMNGYYHNLTSDSLAEAMLKVENGGAIAVWASSGLTFPTAQAEMNQQLYQQLFGNQPVTVGEAIQRAKAATSDLDIRRTWILFGDPTMRIR